MSRAAPIPPRRRALLIALAAALAAVAPAGAGDPPERGSPASRLPRGGSASEYWDLTGSFASGHRVFARFSITNEGPGSGTAFAVGHIVFPDGRTVPFENGRRKGRWSLSPDGLDITIGSSRLELREPVRRFSVHKRKKGIQIDLRFRPPSPVGRPWDPDRGAAAGAYQMDLLHPAAPAEGTLWVRGMPEPVAVTGAIGATHTWMSETESRLALRRIDFHSLQEGPSLYLSDLTTPEGDRTRWLVLEEAGQVVLAAREFELTLGEPLAGAAKAGYPVPGALQIRAPGLEGEIRPTRVLVGHDPLELVPQPFRFFLGLQARPHRVWIESSFAVRIRPGSDDPIREVTGAGITSVTFLNPVPSTVANPSAPIRSTPSWKSPS